MAEIETQPLVNQHRPIVLELLLQGLSKGNDDYEKKFGFIFIVCATGKSAEEMLNILLERMENNREVELKIAAGEQDKITLLRLEKMLCQQ